MTDYIFDDHAGEGHRLGRQAALYRRPTGDFIQQAWGSFIPERLVDLGAGTGHTTALLHAAQLQQRSHMLLPPQIVAVDNGHVAAAVLEHRVRLEIPEAHVSLRPYDLTKPLPPLFAADTAYVPFGVFGRFVLAHLPDPIFLLKQLIEQGARTFLFMEMFGDGARQYPQCPACDYAETIMRAEFHQRGLSYNMGIFLARTLRAAGLKVLSIGVTQHVEQYAPEDAQGKAPYYPEWLEECSKHPVSERSLKTAEEARGRIYFWAPVFRVHAILP